MNLQSLSRIVAIFLKEIHQMRRDRLTFAIMFGIPILQLILFGFAINTDPKSLPTAIYVEDASPIVRDMLAGMESSGYYVVTQQLSDPRQSADLLGRGEVAFVVSFPAGFTREFVRGNRPQVLIEADASDPAASSNAIARLETIFLRALQADLNGPLSQLRPTQTPFELIVHRKYNPEGVTQYNIVPGLLGIILTLTMVMNTAISMAREMERGTMENLLALPARPYEVMVGKIAPYIAIGFIQTLVVLAAAKFVFDVPFVGSVFALLFGIIIFMLANLALGFTFSTMVRSQLQAMQLTFFFFLPSIMLSGFMFPYRGMPEWAQLLGEVLPLTHFLRIIRGVMLKGAELSSLQTPLLMMTGFILVVGALAMLRYRQTLD